MREKQIPFNLVFTSHNVRCVIAVVSKTQTSKRQTSDLENSDLEISDLETSDPLKNELLNSQDSATIDVIQIYRLLRSMQDRHQLLRGGRE